MSLTRTILAFFLMTGLLVSFSPAHPAEKPMAAKADHSCCKKDAQENQPTKKSQKCDGGSCSMQCCRIVSTTAFRLNFSGAPTAAIEFAPIPPAALHSLTDPDSLFHPPRA